MSSPNHCSGTSGAAGSDLVVQARVLAAQDKAEDGLALLDGEAVDAFAASREELRGDLLVQLQRPEEAHAAYSKAKELLSQDAAIGGLQLKLDDLARGEA